MNDKPSEKAQSIETNGQETKSFDLIVNIITLKRPCATYLLLLQIYKYVFCKRSPLKMLTKILEK